MSHARREEWEVSFEKLKEFRKRHGHCNVPSCRGPKQKTAPYEKLGRWVEKQRTKFRQEKLCPSYVERLSSLDFEFRRQLQSKPRNPVSTELQDAKFTHMLGRVVEFVEREGHGWIPQQYGDPVLANWARNRRNDQKKGTLRSDRYEALTKAGFVWNFKRGQNTHVRENQQP